MCETFKKEFIAQALEHAKARDPEIAALKRALYFARMLPKVQYFLDFGYALPCEMVTCNKMADYIYAHSFYCDGNVGMILRCKRCATKRANKNTIYIPVSELSWF